MNTNSIMTASGESVIEITYQKSSKAALSPRTIRAVISSIKEGNPYKHYWDYQEEISEKSIKEALEKNPEFPLDHIYQEFIDDSDIGYNLELEAIKNALNDNKDLIIKDVMKVDKEIGEDVDLDFEELAKEVREEFMGYIEIDIDMKSLLKNDVLVRVTMYSNYDCINSWWLTRQEIFRMDSYFGDMINMLHFNPRDIEQALKDKGYETEGKWINAPKKNPLVTIPDFFQEMENMSCGANLLTFPGLVNAYELLQCGTNKVVVDIPSKSICGMYSSFQGGGSVLEMSLLRQHRIVVGKSYGDNGYLKFGLSLDKEAGSRSIKEVYGISNSVFGEYSLSKYKPHKPTKPKT